MGSEEIKVQGKYGKYTEADYNYLVALGGESSSYEGFVAVAYVVLNRVEEWDKPFNEIINKNQFAGFNENEIGMPRNEKIEQAALDVLQGKIDNPIGEALFFRGRTNNNDLWIEKDKCKYVKEVEGNVFFGQEDYKYVQ